MVRRVYGANANRLTGLQNDVMRNRRTHAVSRILQTQTTRSDILPRGNNVSYFGKGKKKHREVVGITLEYA